MMAKTGRLIALKEKRTGTDSHRTHQIERFESMINKVTVEQNGPVKAVIKAEGVHQGGGGEDMAAVCRQAFILCRCIGYQDHAHGFHRQ